VAAWTERSVVLRVAAWIGVVALAAGIGGASGAPAGLVLAGLALVAAAVHGDVDRHPGGRDGHAGRDRHHGRRLGLEWGAAGWAALAGLAVPLSGAAQLGWPAAGVLTDLGLATEVPHAAAAATGLVAGLALGITAHRRRSLPVAFLALGCVLTGLVTTWVGLEPSGPASLVAAAALLLIVQVAAGVWHDDAFWQRPTALLAQGGEVVTAVLTVRLAGDLVVAPSDPGRNPTAGLAAALVALTWLVAETHVQRFAVGRPGAFRLDRSPLPLSAALAPFAAALAASAAVALLTGSGPATAAALTGFGAAVLLAPMLPAGWPGRGDTHQILAAHLLAWAPFVAERNLPAVAVVALVGALAIAGAAVGTTRSAPTGFWPAASPAGGGQVPGPGGPSGAGHPGGTATVPGPGAPNGVTRATARVLSLLALVPIASGAVVLAVAGEGIAAATAAVAAAWLVAAVLDRAEQPAGALPLALAPRLAALVPLAFLPLLPDHAEAAIAGLVAVLALGDALRRDEPLLVAGAGAAMPFVVLGLAGPAGWTTADAGVIVCLTGVAWLGIGACLPARWTPPMLLSAVGAAAAGLALSAEHPPALATNLLLVGGSVAAAGVAVRRSEVTTIGLAAATFGSWSHLQLAGVTAAEPYVAPVAALLLLAGLHAQREHGVGSWLAHAPAVVLMGGAALLERLAGGPAWHALVAGAVGTVAVAAGGARRLAGPLLVGTLVVVGTTIHETLGVTTAVGTPVWLAIGGVVLLGAGVGMERRGVGPVEAGRRLIDVVNERFA
jgi:hypothetical protein